MRKVVVLSLLLVAGLVLSQAGPALAPGVFEALEPWVELGAMGCLAYIMLGVGLEFEPQRGAGGYMRDYAVAAGAATVPWILCGAYMVFVMSPGRRWSDGDTWREALLVSRFAAPTSAGVLFAMLAAAGLAATWTFRKARILAILDDLDTVLLMIPLKVLIVGLRWQLAFTLAMIGLLVALAFTRRRRLRWRVTPARLVFAALAITAAREGVYLVSALYDDVAPIQIEVLLPAFVLGLMLVPPPGLAEAPAYRRTSDIVVGGFMLLVGLAMPPIVGPGRDGVGALGGAWPGVGVMALHVGALTLLSNLGKAFVALFYRREASGRERLALAVALFPRGEVGAGVLVVSLGYGISGPAVTAALLSLCLNLAATGGFILVVRRLLGSEKTE